MTKVYELYHCTYNGKVVYIGQGARGRHRHCNSGCSHVFELNEIYFTEGKDALQVSIKQEFFDKIEAEKQEVLSIQKYRPRLNKSHNGCSVRQLNSDESKNLKKELLGKQMELVVGELSLVDKNKYFGLVNEFYDYFGYRLIKDKSFIIFGAIHYKKEGLNYLRNLSTTIRTQAIVSRRVNNPYILFIKVMKLCCGIDLVAHLDMRPASLDKMLA